MTPAQDIEALLATPVDDALRAAMALLPELKRLQHFEGSDIVTLLASEAQTIIAALEAVQETLDKPLIAEGWQMVPVEPTEAMLRASRGAIKALIDSVPKDERKARFKNQGLYSCLVDEPEKSKIRYQAMLVAAPTAPDDITPEAVAHLQSRADEAMKGGNWRQVDPPLATMEDIEALLATLKSAQASRSGKHFDHGLDDRVILALETLSARNRELEEALALNAKNPPAGGG